MEVPVYNMQGESVGSMQIDEQALGGEVNAPLLKQAYVRYHANLRQGSARTRGRGETDGSTRKIYKQKGTGRARMGPVRSPIRRGGGHAFPKRKEREHYRLDMPVKMRRKANRNALLAKLVDNEVIVLNKLEFTEPKTGLFRNLVSALGINRTALFALADGNRNVMLSARNVEGVTTCPARELNCFGMLNHRKLVIAKNDLEAWLSGASSKTGKDAKRIAGRGGEVA